MKADMVYDNTDAEPSEGLLTVAQALAYLLTLHPRRKMGQLQLVQLLWAADRRHIRHYGGTISESDYVATINGPVSILALAIVEQNSHILAPRDIAYLRQFFTSDNRDIALSADMDDDCLSDLAKDMLSETYDLLGDKSATELSRLSRRYPEWIRFRALFASGSCTPRAIDKLDFFRNPTHDKYFAEDDEILHGAREIFLEDCELLTAVNNLDGA